MGSVAGSVVRQPFYWGWWCFTRTKAIFNRLQHQISDQADIQPYWLDAIPICLATYETDMPGSKICFTIASFCSAVQRLRRWTPAITSTGLSSLWL